ncbi:DegT/DnrJ/EryC1/StrS family aminotransferase [Bacillus licheniformis]|nr:DegT/DnrJ/EryC1/StrS family aminotransferase [Bacillus licheniformis]
MKYLSLNNLKRLYLADRYIAHLQQYEDRGLIKLPQMTDDHVWHLFTIKILNGNRDQVKDMMLKFHNVQTDIYYPIYPIIKHTTCKANYRHTSLPVTESVHNKCFSFLSIRGSP